MKAEQKFEKRHRLIREIIETIVLTALMFVIINLAVQNYDVEGPSMEPTLHNQERIMVDKVSYLFHPPARGDVIVFIAPPHPDQNYVKRIIGIPGDTIVIHNELDAQSGETKTTVKVDGVLLNETYVHAGYDGNVYGDMTRVVTADHYFVMGDDRKNSSDSREWGLVPRGNIIGRAALVYWPLGQDNDGLLGNFSSVFANVHQTGNHTSSLEDGNAAFASIHLGAGEALLGLAPALLLLSSWARQRHHRQKQREHTR